MGLNPNKKIVTQNGNQDNATNEVKYGEIHIPQKIEYVKFMINMDKKTRDHIDQYILSELQKGTKMRDPKTGEDKKINMSIWLRKVVQDEFERNGFFEELRKEKEKKEEKKED